ncbi:MAG TPA: DNA translocase FtsK 4TM domain-containing protein [Bacteroidales bacterium]|nr:DNA translocase FtsK 4TM domain-containing protein [Bacteroidales bacterium]HRX96302.1 DNA translocase FtsK 4TM domain-containing protein [Bacteroidales bacterium]
MAKKANSLKNSKKTSGSAASKRSRKNPFKPVIAFLKSEKFRKVAGLFFVMFSVVLFFAFISYFFTWQADHAVKPGEDARNWIGKAGRAISMIFIERWFGIGSFAFVLLFFMFGVKWLMKVTLLPLWKTTRLALLFMLWFSLSLGFLFGGSDNFSVLGGEFGKVYSDILSEYLGRIGAGLLLLFIGLSYLIFNHDFSFGFLKGLISFKKKQADPRKGNKPGKEDKYNTAEFAVDDEEDPDDDDDEFVKPIPTSDIDDEDDERPEQLIVLDTSIPKADPDPQNEEIEMTIETPKSNGDSAEEEGEEEETEHHTIDEHYDPWLDLPGYKFPDLNLLEEYGTDEITVQKEELERNKNRIVETLSNYSIQIKKIKATIGPTVTLYEIIPAPGIRISKIKNLEDDIALSLAALGIRIIAPIPGKGTIGIEVPNSNPDIVAMKSVLGSDKFQNTKYELPFGMGKTIANESFIADLTKMPHILMAGATGQGKSVGLNAIISSLLYKKHPSELKFVMVDPKKVELTLYSKIERHFLAKLPDSEEAIITDTRKVVRTLNSLSIEMDNRYELLKDAQVRNIKEYNVKFKARKLSPLHGHRFLPYIVLVIDEFADLIMTAGKEIEVPITRLAQLARAVGIHLIIATQRPSVNIITGSIKANFPARIAFRVISKIDSRTILDTGGADQLIGRGDMLLSTGSDLLRLQCAFIDTPEIDKLTDFIGSQRAYPDAFHLPDFQDEQSEGPSDFDPNERDELFEDAARIIVQTQQGSTSLLQRKLKLGYNRAGRIIDQLEAAGIVGPFEGSKAREVKVATEVALEQFLKDLDQI